MSNEITPKPTIEIPKSLFRDYGEERQSAHNWKTIIFLDKDRVIDHVVQLHEIIGLGCQGTVYNADSDIHGNIVVKEMKGKNIDTTIHNIAAQLGIGPEILGTHYDTTNKMSYIAFEKLKRKYSKGTNIVYVSANDMKKLKIPIPCPNNPKKSLEIQNQIVNILDKFDTLTNSTSEGLLYEIELRKKQYNYYRDQLLTFKEGEVEWVSLGDLGDLVRGNGLTKSDFTETGIGCIHYAQIYTDYETYTKKTKTFVSEDFAKKLTKAQIN